MKGAKVDRRLGLHSASVASQPDAQRCTLHPSPTPTPAPPTPAHLCQQALQVANVQQRIQIAALQGSQPSTARSTRAAARLRRALRRERGRRLQAGRAACAGGAAVLQRLFVQCEGLRPVSLLLCRQPLVLWAGASLAQAHQALQPVWLLQPPIHLLLVRGQGGQRAA